MLPNSMVGLSPLSIKVVITQSTDHPKQSMVISQSLEFGQLNVCRLFPALRKYGIRFHAYSPLAYVLVSQQNTSVLELNSPKRFRPNRPIPF